LLMMVRETGQSEALQATGHTVVDRPPGPAILNENEILERAAHHFRLRPQGDLDAVGKLGTVTYSPTADPLHPRDLHAQS
jgi:hypothetical protein